MLCRECLVRRVLDSASAIYAPAQENALFVGVRNMKVRHAHIATTRANASTAAAPANVQIVKVRECNKVYCIQDSHNQLY